MSLHDLITDALATDDGSPSAVIAAKLVARLRESEPELLDAWLHDNAERFVTVEITNQRRADRSLTVRRAASRAFGKAAEEGDLEALGHFRVEYVVDTDNSRRRVADMTGSDHRFVADTYKASGKRDLMLASFHQAVAKKVGKKRTAEVMSEEKYDELLQSILRPAA